MDYEKDFYILENIIGYTGDRQNKPTVYFLKKFGVNSNKFGRITQYYPDNLDNEGRSIVRDYYDYMIANTIEGEGYEYYGGQVRHNSRHKYISVVNDERLQAVLATSIVAFPNKKPKYN